MIESTSRLSRHVFLSYPRKDRQLAERLFCDLERAGFNMWMDDVALEPGTPNWETNIRKAINESYAVVLVCTPNTVASTFVNAELQLAQTHDRLIIPAWVNGSTWVECIPMAFVNYQFVDCQDDRYQSGVRKLIDQLRKHISEKLPKLSLVDSLNACPDTFIPLLITKQVGESLDLATAGDIIDHGLLFDRALPPNFQVIAVNPAAYDYFEAVSDDIYAGFLTGRYSPYTYGRDWVLAKASIYVSLLALPWEWLKHKRGRPLIDVIPHYPKRRTPLNGYGFDSSGVWAIVDQGFDNACGLFTSDNSIASQAFDPHTKELAFTLGRHRDRLRKPRQGNSGVGELSLDEVDPQSYEWKLVIAPDIPFRASELARNAVFVI